MYKSQSTESRPYQSKARQALLDIMGKGYYDPYQSYKEKYPAATLLWGGKPNENPLKPKLSPPDPNLPRPREDRFASISLPGQFKNFPGAFEQESNRLKSLAESGNEQAKYFSTFFNRYAAPTGINFPGLKKEKYGNARNYKEEKESWEKMTPETRRAVYRMGYLPSGAKIEDLKDK